MTLSSSKCANFTHLNLNSHSTKLIHHFVFPIINQRRKEENFYVKFLFKFSSSQNIIVHTRCCSFVCAALCRYSLYSAVSTVSPECLHPHLTAITTVMLMALKSNEGITVRSGQTGGTVEMSGELVSLKRRCPSSCPLPAYRRTSRTTRPSSCWTTTRTRTRRTTSWRTTPSRTSTMSQGAPMSLSVRFVRVCNFSNFKSSSRSSACDL